MSVKNIPLIENSYSNFIKDKGEDIEVITIFKTNSCSVYKVKYKGKVYKVDKQGIHYTKMAGDTLYHIYGVQSEDTFLKLSLNSKTLQWKLLEISFVD